MSKTAKVLSLVVLTQAGIYLLGQATGEMKVKVLSPNAGPVANATVWALPADGRPTAAAIPACLTQAAGTCSIHRLSPGSYRVTAMKESDGYPNTAYEFYLHGRKPQFAQITAGGAPTEVTIDLGPKAADLSLSLANSAKKAGINKKPTVTLRLAAEPQIFIRSIVDDKILLPPDVPVLVEVSVEGYKPWKSSTVLRARSGESIKLPVSLQPE